MKFSDLTRDFPEEREALANLDQLIRTGSWGEMTLDHLVLETHPHSVESLVRILETSARRGVLRRVYRVESPGTGGPIEDFTDWRAIPETVFDPHRGVPMAVVPDALRIVYAPA